MKKIILAVLVIQLIGGLIACTKHHDDIEEIIPLAQISFSSPVTGMAYTMGDQVNIKALAISTATIHGYDITIRKAGDKSRIFYINKHEHNDTLLIDQIWENSLTSKETLEAEITLYLDHSGHSKKAKANFTVN